MGRPLIGMLFISSALFCVAAQTLETPERGVDVGQDIEMRCHYHDGHSLENIIGINWFKVAVDASNSLYSHLKSETGSVEGEWEEANRLVNGSFETALYRIKVQDAIKSDERNYLCRYTLDDVTHYVAESTLLINVPPTDSHTTISYTKPIIEDITLDVTCIIEEYKHPMKLDVKWKINSTDGTLIDSADISSLPNGEFNKTTARLQRSFSRHDKTLYCAVFWDASELYYVMSGLDVLFSPGTSVPGQELYEVIQLDVVMVNCTANAGNPQGQTYFFDQVDNRYSDQSQLGEITVNATSEERDGNYTCFARNEGGLEGPSGIFYIFVKVPPVFTSKPENNTYLWYRNNDAQVQCSVKARPRASIEWTFEHSSMGEIFAVQHGEDTPDGDRSLLTITHSSLSWAHAELKMRKMGTGRVTICLDHETNQGNMELSFNIISEYEPGEATLDVSSFAVDVDHSVELSCGFSNSSLAGEPPATLYEFLSALPWNSGITQNKINLSIDNVNQQTDYWCAGINNPVSTGQQERGSDSATLKLTVLVPPTFVNQNGDPDVRFTYNESFSLSCDVAAKEQASVSWLKNSDTLPGGEFHDPDESKIQISEIYGLVEGLRSTISRANFPPEYNCETVAQYNGQYQCQASNQDPCGEPRDTVSSAYIVNTEYPAHWNGTDTEVFAEMNHSAVLNCSVCAWPQPNFSWYRNGTLIEAQEDETLEITLTAKEDFTTYWCDANNGIHGIKRFYLTLNESGPPSLSSVGTNLNVTSRVIPVTSQIYSDGGHPPLNFTIWTKGGEIPEYIIWRNDIVHKEEDGDFMANVDGLNPDTAYDIRIVAKNQRQTGDSSSDEFFVHGNTTKSPHINLDTLNVFEDHLEIKWSLEESLQNANPYENAVNVTFCIKYWHADSDEENADIHPGNGRCDIIANREDKTELILGTFDTRLEHYAEFIVYENFLPGSNAGTNEATYVPPAGGLQAGAIVGIALAVILVLVVAGLLIIWQRGMLPTTLKRRGSTDDSVEENVVVDEMQDTESKERTESDYREESEPEDNFYITQKQPRQDNIDDQERVEYATVDTSKLAKVETRPVIYVDLDFPPSNRGNFTVSPVPVIRLESERKQIFNVGNEMVLSAVVEGTSDVSVSWKHGDLDVSTRACTTVTKIGCLTSLTVNDCVKEDSGRYTITASNNVGKATANLYTIVIGTLNFTGMDVAYLNEGDFEIYGNLPGRLQGN